MIYYLKGKITFREKDFVVVEIGGIGYKVLVAPETKDKLKEKATLFCFTQSTDKGTYLYGFIRKEHLEFFEKLINISGIGPKTALHIASIATMEEMKRAIEKEDRKVMEKIFSLGKKKGEQIIFELTRKTNTKHPKEDEVFQALKELGFSAEEITCALGEIPESKEKEDKVREALKILGDRP